MTSENILILLGLLATGAALAIVAAVSIGIRREERRFRERRSFLQEQGDWPGPAVPARFFTDTAPDGVSRFARALTGLWVRREQGTEPLVVPWYERRRP